MTKEPTTLYASDRNVFLFLVGDPNPIEAGLLPDGSRDLYSRGLLELRSCGEDAGHRQILLARGLPGTQRLGASRSLGDQDPASEIRSLTLRP